MEGFLLKKSKERNFGPSWLTDKKKSWNRRWFVLEDQTVTYYQDFDLLSDQPVNKKGSFLIRDCEVLPVSHKTKKNIFCVKDGQNTLFYVQAEDAKLLGIWIRALTAAANGEHKPPELDYDSLYEKLGLDPEVEHEPSAVNRAFRQLALQDKTGRPEGFKELQEAFNHIMAFLNRQEESRTHRMAYYEAVVIKGGPGQGLGIVVQEEADGTNVVQSIRETLRIESITGEVGEEGIEEGDQLLKLGNNDVSQMPLIRVAQRMNDFRIPPGSRVKLTFGRKVLREEMGDEEYDYQEGEEEGEEERYNQDRELDHEAIQENQRQYDNPTEEEPTLNVELSASRDSFGYRRELSDDREEPTGEHNATPTEQEFKFEPSPQQASADAARDAEREAAQKTLQKTLSKYGLDPNNTTSTNTANANAGLQRTPSTYAADANSRSELQRTPSAYSVHASNTASPRSSLRPQSRPDSRSTSPAVAQRPEDNRARSPSQAVPFSGSHSQQRAPSPHFLPRSPTSRSPSPALTRKLSTSSNAGGFAGQQAPSPASSPRSTSPSPRPFSLPVSALRSATSFRSPPQPKPAPVPAPAPAPAAAPLARNNSIAGMPGNNPNITPEIKRTGSVSMINPKEYFVLSSMQSKSPAEIAEMKRDLDFCLKELAAASKRIESLEFHNTHLTAELARYKALYADSAHHERLLETQLEQYLLHSTVTAEFMEESMNDMILVSNQISSNQPIQVSESTNVYLEEMGLGEDESELDGSKASQRNAIAAAAAVDRSGLMLQKWAMTGDSIINKLNRFEETVQQVGGIHKTAAEIRASPRPARQPAPAPAPPVPEPEPEVYASPPQSSANIRQPQQYRAGSGGPVMSPHNRSSAASTSNASTTLSRKAPTPNAYGQTSSPKTNSPKGHTNGYGLREYTPSAGPNAGLRVSTEPAGAQLTRHQSQQWQNHTASSHAYDKQHAPLERTASLNRIPLNDRSSPKPLVSTLMSRPLNTQR